MKNKQGGQITIRAMGADLACIEALLCALNKQGGNGVSCHHVRVYDEDILTIAYKDEASKMLVDEILQQGIEGLNGCIYAMSDSTLEKQLVDLLKLRGRMISVAESFTGGGIAKRITSVSGASKVYFEGINAYNEKAKIKRLGVSPQTLAQYGAVSEKTACEMVSGLLQTGDCDIAIATTGLAGPNSDDSGLPVGLCYIAVGTRENISVHQYHFSGSRDEITEKAIGYALFLAYKQLENL